MAHLTFVPDLAIRAMKLIFEDWICFNCFKFGLEIVDVVAVRAGIGTATSVGEIVTVVLRLIARSTPITARSAKC